MSSNRLKICLITGSRGEYGALRWLMKDISHDPKTALKTLVMGSHFSKEYGQTYLEILADGIAIDVRIDSPFDSASSVSLARAMGQWTAKVAEHLSLMKPDLVVVAGDRYELLSIGSACLLLTIPVAHISGGETTEGAIDEQIRHATTKMSHLHFVSNRMFAGRVRQMGEEGWRICVSGDPGLDTLRRLPLLSKAALEDRLHLDLSRPTALCTFHPVTLESENLMRQIRQLIKALTAEKLQYVLTYPNADFGSRSIIAELQAFARIHPETVRLVPHLGQHSYLSLMAHVRLMVGNSSSGIWEAPSLHLPVVNIGNRQQGRLRAANIIDVPCNADRIRQGIRRAIRYDRSAPCKNPYGDGRASGRILGFIKRVFSTRTREDILKKKFAAFPAHGGA